MDAIPELPELPEWHAKGNLKKRAVDAGKFSAGGGPTESDAL